MEPGLVETPVTGLDGSQVLVRKFSNASIQSAIDRALETVPEGSKGAVTLFSNLQGAKVVTGYKNGHWTVAAAFGYDWSSGGDFAFEGAAKYTW